MSEELALVTEDGIRLHARRWDGGDSPRAGIVLVHGFAASSAEPRVVAVAERFRAAGFEVLAYDARGHGRSGGEATLGDLERHDVAAAAASVGAEPLILVGASVGAIAVLRHAASDPARVAGVVTLSCPAAWRLPRNARGVASALMTQTAPGRWAARRWVGVRIAPPRPRPAAPVELVPDLAVPIALVHGAADPFIAPVDAEALAAAAPGACHLELVEGLGHAYEAASIEPLLRALEWVLASRT